MPPIFQPEAPAKAINKRCEVWVGGPTVKAMLANKIAPGLIDCYLSRYGHTSQLAAAKIPDGQKANLFEAVDGTFGAHGRFDDRAEAGSWELFTDRHRDVVVGAGLGLLALGAAALLRHEPSRRRSRRRLLR